MYKSYLAQSEGRGVGPSQDRIVSETKDGEHIFAVLDGHGRMPGGGANILDLGEFISKNLAETLWQEREKGENIENTFVGCFDKLQDSIKKIGFFGGTTATVLYIDSYDNHHIAYVGDSPIYSIEGSEVKDVIWRDKYHKVKNIYVNEEWKRLEKIYFHGLLKIMHMSGYVADFNITRFLGNSRLKGENHIPEVMTLENKSDKYLLTSDGLDAFGADGLEKIISGLDLETGVDKIMIEYEKKIKKALEFVKEQGIDFSNVNKHIDHATALGVERI